jgi:hypothetical protein
VIQAQADFKESEGQEDHETATESQLHQNGQTGTKLQAMTTLNIFH